MSSGKTHNTMSIIGAGFSMVSGSIILSPMEALPMAAGCLMGILLTPDLDQETKNRVENKLIKSRIFPIRIIGYLYIWYFLPYALWLPHRSFWSHFPIVSTALRLLYLVPLMLIFALALYYAGVEIITFLQYNQRTVILFVLGLVLSDTLHWVMDLPISRELGKVIDGF